MLAFTDPVTSKVHIIIGGSDPESGVPDGVVTYRVDTVPDRYFRDAYVIENGKVVLDLDKCQAIQKNKWRDARKPRLDALDVQFSRALEEDDNTLKAIIVDRKQELRDCTSLDLTGLTAAEIRNTWPDCLK